MSATAGPVAAHLGIDLSEYDARIRTWIPKYGLCVFYEFASPRGRHYLK